MRPSVWKFLAYSVAKLRTATFTTALIATLLLPALSSPIIAHAESVVQYGSAWLSGGGVDIMTGGDGSNKYVNNTGGVSTLTGTKWQCVEMVNRLYLTKGWATTTWSGNGNTIVNDVPNHPGLTAQWDYAISYVNPGDTVTETHSTDGHAAIIDTVDANGTIHIKSQNATLDSSAIITSGSLAAGNAHYALVGWTGFAVQSIIHHPTGTSSHWVPLAGDWDGNGTVTIGLYDPNTATFYLRNSNTSGVSDYAVVYGSGGNWRPIVGDWDGNGTTTIGIYNPATATFYLSNSNTSGVTDYSAVYGSANWIPIAGNWDNYGGDTIGIYNPTAAAFYLSNYNTNPQTNYSAVYGSGGNWVPLAGNWDGYQSDTIGVYAPNIARFYLSNYNTNPQTNYTMAYGSGGSWEPVVGDWDTNGTTTIGVFNPATATFYLCNSNTTTTPTDISFTYGNPS